MTNNTVSDDDVINGLNDTINNQDDTIDSEQDDEEVVNQDNPDNDTDGLSTTTDTARFTDEGGTYERGPSSSPNNDNPNAGNPVHPGVDEDTE